MTKNDIISALFTGKNFNDCLDKMEPDHLREDLKQEVILIICELPELKVIQLHSERGLEFFTVRVILNQIKSKTSPFAKKFRAVHQSLSKNKTEEVTDFEERGLKESAEDSAIREVEKLYWYDKGLIELYVKHGNFRAIQKVTGIPFGSCYKTIKKSCEQIKLKVS